MNKLKSQSNNKYNNFLIKCFNYLNNNHFNKQSRNLMKYAQMVMQFKNNMMI